MAGSAALALAVEATGKQIVLHPAQQKAVDEIGKIKGPCWLRGETGCGKTITSIEACLADFPEGEFEGRVLVIAPERLLMEKWIEEIRLMGEEAFLLGGKEDIAAFLATKAKWIVVSYNCLSFAAGKALKQQAGTFTHMIFDESQKAKSPGTKRVRHWSRFVKANFQTLIKVRPATPRRMLMLSATFVVHSGIDLITQYRLAGIGHEIADVVEYEEKAITPEIIVKVPVGWKEGREKDIAGVLAPRRVNLLQKDVFPPDLPPMIQTPVGISLGSPQDLLDELVKEAGKDGDSYDLTEQWRYIFTEALRGNTGGWEFQDGLGVLAALLREERDLRCTPETMPLMLWNIFLRAEGKMIGPGVAEVLAGFEDTAVVFANHKAPLYRLAEMDHGREVRFYTGEQTKKQARENKHHIQSMAKGGLLLATYAKGGVGVEFTPVKRVVLAQRSPSPADMEQAKARIYRMNSTGQTYAYTCFGTLNGKITDLEKSLSRIIQRKRDEAAIAGLKGTLGGQ